MSEKGDGGMLLVIESDPRFTNKFQKHLKIDKLRPFFVTSGKDGAFLLKSINADFILFNLNSLKSWQEFNKISSYARVHRVPLLFIEGHKKTKPLADRLREKGYTNFIRLPFSIRDLITSVEKMRKKEDPLIGVKLGPKGQEVEVTKKLGSGAMGSVYRAYQPSLDRQVAVKMLATDEKSDPDSAIRFTNEARAIAQMHSAHIVQVYFVGAHVNQPYVVMEFIDGVNLQTYLKTRGSLQPLEALNLIKQVLKGLTEAHDSGKVHRDLKPANIMINQRGHAIILDFGLVREMDSMEMTQAGTVLGTPRYISPEQVNGQQVDQRSDLYSLGIILFELLIGKPPFEGDDFISVLVKHARVPLPQPESFGKSIDPVLFNIVEKLAMKDPDRRYQSAQEAHDDIESYIQSTSQKTLIPQVVTDTLKLSQGLQPSGGIVIDERGTPTHRFGNFDEKKTQSLFIINSLLAQLQDLESVGDFQRGLASMDSTRMLLFSCFDGLAAIESHADDLTAKLNKMSPEELAKLFVKENQP